MTSELDWYRHRKNGASCAKSQAWILEQGLEAIEQIDARKERFDEQQALQLVAGCAPVFVARGKSWQAYDPQDPAQAAEMRKKMMGPHGTLRAPALRFGKVFAIGFHEEMLQAARAAADQAE